MTTREYKIGEAARMLDTTVRSLRYYEEQGLIESNRNSAGTRFYNDAQIGRLQAILDLGMAGFSIDDIRAIATTREQARTGQESSAAMSKLLADKLEEVGEHIKVLELLYKDMAAARRAIWGCRQCQNPPGTHSCPDCPVIKKREQIGMLNLVWDTDEIDGN